MSQGFHPPENLNFTKPEEWGRWIKRFERYRVVSGLKQKDEEIQISSLVYCLGAEAEDIINSFSLTEAQKKSYKEVKSKFEDFFSAKKNVIYERAKFNSRVQETGESVDAFITALYALADNCDYDKFESVKDEKRESLKDEMIRDRIVVGIKDSNLSEEMQLCADLDLKKAKDLARQSEAVRNQQKDLRPANCAEPSQVDAVYHKSQSSRRQPGPSRAYGSSTSRDDQNQRCRDCARFHTRGYCPARNQQCRRCGKYGHFHVACRSSRSVSEVGERYADENYYDHYDSYETNEYNDYDETSDACDTLFIGHLEDETSAPWFTYLYLSGRDVKFKIDTGADVSIISASAHRQLRPSPRLKPCTNRLTSPGGVVEAHGQFIARASCGEENAHIRIVVVPDACAKSNLLSRDAAVKFGLVQRLDNLEQDSDVFGTSGLLKCNPVKIVLRDDCEPYCVPSPRRIPIPRLPLVEAELKRMVKLGIIEPVSEPTDWCSPMIEVPKKDGSVRICCDLTKLNRAVKRERYVLPTLEDILPALHGACVFTTLDAVSGFHQIPLDESSARLTTFITPFGRYCYRRLCFGISSAPEIFQRLMSELLSDIPGVVVLMDDILCFSKDAHSHEKLLKTVFSRIQKSGLKLNEKKCVFRQSSVKYFGHIISKEGVTPDPERVKAIKNIPPPKSLGELRSFVGVVNYMGRFVRNLSRIMHPLNELLKKSSSWLWDASQQNSYEEIMKALSTSPTLAFYDVSKPTIITADACSYGIGGAILQKHGDVLKPVEYCSRTLSPSERKYAMIEKELLASTWVCERFSKYLVGLPNFELQTDHKPLIPLLNSTDIDKAPLRCQRLLLRMMRFTPTAVYVPGKDLSLADALSRNPISVIPTHEILELQRDIGALEHVATQNAASECDLRLPVIRRESLADDEIQSVIRYVQEGWPKYAQDMEAQLIPYFHDKSSLSTSDGLLLHGQRIVIPQTLRTSVLEALHDGHQGLNKCLERAKSSVWWPHIYTQLKKTIASCQFCEEHRPAQRHEPLIPSDLPERPWQRVSADFCELKKRKYLVVYDQFSRWLEIITVPNLNCDTVSNILQNLFARWGIFQTLVTDNGPPFSSHAFNEFAKRYGFTHVTSSPRFPQANGAAERAVGIAKRILQQNDVHTALLAYRSCAHSATGVSPAKLFLGRELQTRIPILEANLRPRWPDFNDIRGRDARYKDRMKSAYDKRHGARPLSQLQPHELVRVKLPGDKTWGEPVKVLQKCAVPRSYIVQADNGPVRRNRYHLLRHSPVNGDHDNEHDDHDNANERDVEQNPPTLRRSSRMPRIVEKYQAGFA